MAASSNFSTSNQYIKYDILVDELSTSIANNTSSVRVRVRCWRTNTGYTTYGTGTCYCSIDGTSYSQSISSSQKITYNSNTVLFDRTVTVSHGADGKKTLYVSASISHARFSSSTNGFYVTLSTIPRKADFTSAPNFNDTEDPTINYTNAAGSSTTTLQACISLDGTTDDIAYRDISKTGTSYQFELSSAERNVLLNATPNSNTLDVWFIIKTVLGGTTYYSSAKRTMTVVNAAPVISGVSYEDSNASTVAITGDNQKIIQGNSTLLFHFASLEALKGASLVSLVVDVNAYTWYDSISGTSLSNYDFNFGTVDSSQNETATISVVDSRMNRTTITIPVSILAWSLPTAIISLNRVNNFYSETDLKVQSSYSSLDSHNTVTIQYQYKEHSAGTYGAAVTINDNTTYQITLDNTKEWDIKVTVSDLIGSTVYNLKLARGIPIIFFDRTKHSVGIDCFPENYGTLEVSGRNATDLLLHFMAKVFKDEDTLSVELPVEVDADKTASMLIFSPGNAFMAMVKADLNPTIQVMTGTQTASVVLENDNKTFTITIDSTLSGNTTVLVGLT